MHVGRVFPSQALAVLTGTRGSWPGSRLTRPQSREAEGGARAVAPVCSKEDTSVSFGNWIFYFIFLFPLCKYLGFSIQRQKSEWCWRCSEFMGSQSRQSSPASLPRDFQMFQPAPGLGARPSLWSVLLFSWGTVLVVVTLLCCCKSSMIFPAEEIDFCVKLLMPNQWINKDKKD